MRTVLLFIVSTLAINLFPLPGLSAVPDVNRSKVSANPLDTSTILIQLVKDATELVKRKGEAAFKEFNTPGSRWRRGETYIFVLDPRGNMLVNADQSMVGKNQLDLKDVNGKPIIKGLLNAATPVNGKTGGWYHYEWPVPGGIMPRWKSSYVQLVKAPSGKQYILGSGVYNDRMERAFVIDAVKDAVAEIEKDPTQAYKLFHDPTGPFRAKDAYIFVVKPNGIEIVNGGFPNLEGRNVMELKDTRGKYLVKEMMYTAQTNGSGWVDYMWPKPGESLSTQKSTYVSKAKVGNDWVLVACGVYLADAPKETKTTKTLTAPEVMDLVRSAAAIFEEQGEKSYADFRVKNTKWNNENTYFFVWSMDGIRILNAGDPSNEGQNVSNIKDIMGRPWGKMFLDAASSPTGEGWVHYIWPEPGSIFPIWKSSFVKRVKFPSGDQYLIGCGIYNMQMDKVFIEDVVNKAADLVGKEGEYAFEKFRDKTGPFLFMNTYVFVDDQNGVELVNGAFPSMEGRNLMNLKDARGKLLAREYINSAVKQGSAWVDYYWYKPGDNRQAHKYSYVKKVQYAGKTYIVGSGYYADEQQDNVSNIQKLSWNNITKEKLSNNLQRQVVYGEKGTLAQFTAVAGTNISRHSHPSEEYLVVRSGSFRVIFDDREEVLKADDILVIPPDVPHSIVTLKDAVFLDYFSPVREDWLQSKEQYLKHSN